jgi:hypothetical protein
MPNSPGLQEIFEVNYPDVRRGPGGTSRALFRARDTAFPFAKRYGVEVIQRWVSYLDFQQLSKEGFLEGGSNQWERKR